MEKKNKNSKVDISSTALEKGIDIAKGFIDKLVSPPVEELGLLIKDQISLWRFSNQIKILNKAKVLCEKNNVSTKCIPPKLLCPYLENASLEDDDELQDKWAILLVNMVDSEQNIQNHVFPYILSQISKDEFNLLEFTLLEKKKRVSELEKELSEFISNRDRIRAELEGKIEKCNTQIDVFENEGNMYSQDSYKVRSTKRSLESGLRSLKLKEPMIKRKMAAPESIPEDHIKEFEMANIIRLGLAKVCYEASADTHSIDIPNFEEASYTSVDFDIDIYTESTTILTELGELFIEACCEKNA